MIAAGSWCVRGTRLDLDAYRRHMRNGLPKKPQGKEFGIDRFFINIAIHTHTHIMAKRVFVTGGTGQPNIFSAPVDTQRMLSQEQTDRSCAGRWLPPAIMLWHSYAVQTSQRQPNC